MVCSKIGGRKKIRSRGRNDFTGENAAASRDREGGESENAINPTAIVQDGEAFSDG